MNSSSAVYFLPPNFSPLLVTDAAKLPPNVGLPQGTDAKRFDRQPADSQLLLRNLSRMCTHDEMHLMRGAIDLFE